MLQDSYQALGPSTRIVRASPVSRWRSSGSASVRPWTTRAGAGRREQTPRASPGAGRQSSSVNATSGAPAARQPWFRCAAGPALAARSRSVPRGRRGAVANGPSAPGARTTTTSNRSAVERLRRRAPRGRNAAASRAGGSGSRPRSRSRARRLPAPGARATRSSPHGGRRQALAARAGRGAELVPHARASRAGSSPRAGSTCAPTSPSTGCRSGWTACARSTSAPGTASGRSRWSAAGAEVVALDLDDERELDWPPRRRPRDVLRRRRAARASALATRRSARRWSASCAASTTRPPRSSAPSTSSSAVGADPPARPAAGAGADREPLHGHLHLRRGVRPARPRCCRSPVSRFRADRDSDVVFWQPSARTWKRMMWTAGFDRVERARAVHDARRRTRGKEFAVRHLVLHSRKG